MKIVIAPNTFKGSLDATKAAESIQKGLTKVLPQAEIIIHPVADGGDHTLKVVTGKVSSKILSIDSFDPLSRLITGRYGILKDNTALIKMAVCSGIKKKKKK